ncbi:MAG TPA: hypothetical protein O0X25_00945 [Methanocorpusculum sp.]|nr:hypothetical protein [Methanocorpusculum sp.]HJJ39873.1 hypothetical protein [Methanocorpusculum sp.]HJJ49174.1 hypothetical protein [Methanocorpusculum sp.]HJJ56832.1 hypothetical protein [Methanocorpusculum sp.]
MSAALYGGTGITEAVLSGPNPHFQELTPGEKLRVVIFGKRVLLEFLGRHTCGNPYEEDVVIGELDGIAKTAVLAVNSKTLFAVVTEVSPTELTVQIAQR